MPTARPIIDASAVVVSGRSKKYVAPVMPSVPSSSPMTALRIGMPAATNEPNVMTRTTSATAMPMSSEVPPGCIISCMP